MKEIINKNPKLIFVIPLGIFLLLGLLLLFFAVKYPENVPVYGWITIILLVLLPAVCIYGFIFGFHLSEKQQRSSEAHRNIITYSKQEIWIHKPIVDGTYSINWSIIDKIVYFDYPGDDHAYYTFYLNDFPEFIKNKKQWWLNRLFPVNVKMRKFTLYNDCQNFYDLPEKLNEYLNVVTDIDFADPRKGILISKKEIYKSGYTETIEHWQPSRDIKWEKILFQRSDNNA